MALLISFLALILAVNAVPAPNWPINSQLPPVARVSKPFEFVFSEGTFSDSSNMTYSLSGAPSWLKIDSSSRKLYGTPGSDDANSVQFDLVASDDSGTAQMSTTLVVSKEEGPAVGKAILPQLAKVGPTSDPSTLYMYPGRSFSFSFAPDTFLNTQYTTIYYATSTGNAPLPSWVGFDAANLSFSGTSPSSPSSGPQTFTFNLIASDVPGFSGAAVSFQIVVGSHILTFKENEVELNFTQGQPFSTTHFLSILTLDGKEPASNDIASIKVDGPDWLHLDNNTVSLAGTAPQDAGDENVTISVTDIYQDVAKLVVNLKVSQLFAEGVDSCNATVGQEFSYVFAKTLLDPSATLTVDLGQASAWAKYDSATRTLSGKIPDSMKPQTVSIKLIATRGSTREMRNLDINITKKGSNDTDEKSTGGGSGIHEKAGIIAIAVVVPVVVLISLAIILCCWLRKRKAAAKPKDDQEAKEKMNISRPKIPELPCGKMSEAPQPLERADTKPDSPTHSDPPQLDLGPLWEVDSLQQDNSDKPGDDEARASRSVADWGFGPSTIAETNEEKQQEDSASDSKRDSRRNSPLRRSTTNYSRKREPLKTIQPRSFKRDSTLSAKSKRYSRRSSGIPSVASGLPVRLSGAGHGAGGVGPPGHGVVRISWQNTQASFHSDDTGIENIAPLFPRPPQSRHSYSSRAYDYPKRLSLRPVDPSSSTLSESESLEAFIHGRAKSRNSDSPMFSARLNSKTSSGLRALEKSRRTPSGAETAGSISIYADEIRQSPPRPVSTAMSGSVYTDDVRHSVQVRPLSQISNAQKRGSQPNFAKKYSEIIAPLPRFWSQGSLGQGSLASNRRQESGDSLTGSDDYHDLIDEREEPNGQRWWYKVHPVTHARTASADAPERVDAADDRHPGESDPMKSRVRRMSLVRTGGRGRDSSPGSRSDRRWRLAENEERRPVSIEDGSSIHRTITGSLRGDLAFV
ncbi:transmembrane glycoprotein, putative [Paecilomyces variotii No. 5]|uniref:Transmembrane glycoprotein, putative n=1 Tax=Byssochlamys spectabilis (strain No. 5 / NBRC 109023) TaxID=1356009 RepID=V5FZY4_BYSSN|nr:transmembrane glycoprotein, putative [Paecilomyces variotii No. 5]